MYKQRQTIKDRNLMKYITIVNANLFEISHVGKTFLTVL